jgi:hypothetical protein
MGMKRAEVEKILPVFAGTIKLLTRGDGRTHDEFYRLDNAWNVTVKYDNTAGLAERPKLQKKAHEIAVNPRSDFTGTWTTWYVNGQKHVVAE